MDTKFFKLINVFQNAEEANLEATGERIFNIIIQELKEDNIPLSNLVEFVSDG